MNDEFWNVIIHIATEIHPDRISTISKSIRRLNSVSDLEISEIRKSLTDKGDLLTHLYNEWMQVPQLSPSEIALALEAASKTVAVTDKKEIIEMVWSGPSTGLVPARHTEQVLKETIRSAKLNIFIVSFVAYNIETVKSELKKAISRGVEVKILLESPKIRGGKVDFDSISKFKKDLPTISFYGWISSDEEKGSVHAKCIVADNSLAFISSANLTKAAMEKNMELGVLVRGGSLPARLDQHLNGLITAKIIEPV